MDRPEVMTGNIKFRTGFRKRMVLMVEFEGSYYSSMYERWQPTINWRDATSEDLIALTQMGAFPKVTR